MKARFKITLGAALVAAVLFACEDDGNENNTSDKWAANFLERPSSNSIHILGQSNIKISNLSFNNIDGVAIRIENCENVEITENDFANSIGGIYVLNSKNVTITWNRFYNIGDGTIGAGHSNYIQFDKTVGGYIAYNKGKGGNTEDKINIYLSGGESENDPLIIEHNHFEGIGWTSTNGSGIMLGDFGGSHTVARYNRLLNPGQVGIGIASGTDIRVIGNIVYGEQMPESNVGIYVWNQYDHPLEDAEVSGNNVRWYNENGIENPYWNGESERGLIPIGEATNNWHADIDPNSLRVEL